MDLSTLGASPYPEAVLLLGGAVALFIGAYGDKDDSRHSDEIARVLAFILGLALMVVGWAYWREGGAALSSILVMGLLGFGLFMRVFRKVNWSAGIALLVGIVTFVLLYEYGVSNSIDFLTDTLTLAIVTLVIMFIVFLLLHFLESITDFLGAIVSFRPLLAVLGLLGIVEAVLMITGTSLSGLLA